MNSSLGERFSFVLSAGIHFGEFFLGGEVLFLTLDKDSLWSILPWRSGFLSYSRQGFTLVSSSLAERFCFVLSAGIHFGEFFLGREVLFHTLGRDSLW